MATKISHHIFVSGTPICGNKASNLVAFTSASPADCLCGRCRIVQKSKKAKGFLEGVATSVTATAKTEIVASPVVPLVAAPAAVSLPEVNVKPAKAPKAKAAKPVVNREVKTFLLDPVVVHKPNGKVDMITGTCPICKTHKRTIHAADAFQVKCCVACQKKAVARRVNEARKAKRAAAKKAERKAMGIVNN